MVVKQLDLNFLYFDFLCQYPFTERSNISIYPPILINNSVYWTKVRKNVHGKKKSIDNR